MNTAYNDLVLSEQEYEDFLNPDAASMVQPAEFITTAVVCAGGYKKIQFMIDALSAYDAGGKIKTLTGEHWGSSTQGFDRQNGNVGTIDVAAAPNPGATYFIGTSEEGIFLVPEGDWSFMAVADGYAIDCQDSDCAQDAACRAIENWYVWYVDNISLNPVMVGTNTAFEEERLCSSYPGGGMSSTTMMDKIAIVEGYQH